MRVLLDKDETNIRSQFETLHEVHKELRRLALSADYSDDKAKAIAAKTQPVHEQQKRWAGKRCPPYIA